MFQEISSVLKVKSRIKRVWRTYTWQSRWHSSVVGELNVAVFMASVRSKSLLVFSLLKYTTIYWVENEQETHLISFAEFK